MKCLLPVLINRYNDAALLSGNERLTQIALAEKTGVSPSTINRLFNGSARRLDFGTIETLCSFFDCQVADLLTLAEEGGKA